MGAAAVRGRRCACPRMTSPTTPRPCNGRTDATRPVRPLQGRLDGCGRCPGAALRLPPATVWQASGLQSQPPILSRTRWVRLDADCGGADGAACVSHGARPGFTPRSTKSSPRSGSRAGPGLPPMPADGPVGPLAGVFGVRPTPGTRASTPLRSGGGSFLKRIHNSARLHTGRIEPPYLFSIFNYGWDSLLSGCVGAYR
jgi:hypothetical protein